MSKVNIADIRVNGGTQSRAGINRETVSEYAEAMQGGAIFPPLIVFNDGADYWLADGFHRYHAYASINAHDVPVDIRQGSQRDAILFSVGANASHGLRRTNDDKRRAVMVLLNDPEWSAWPQTKIAAACGVSREYVSRLSRDLSCDRSQDSTRTVERGGTTYQQNTANIGAGSRADQVAGRPDSQQGMAENGSDHDLPATQSNVDQEPLDPAEAKLRREIGKLTTEAMIDEIIGLRADLSDAKAKGRAQREEITSLKSQLRDLSDSDSATVIRRLQRDVRDAENAKWRATEEQQKAMKQVYALKKRVEELERMEIAL